MEFLLSKFKEDGILSCIICLDNINDAHLCPFCSKLFCFPCIEVWIQRTSASCPNCSQPLSVRELVKCRWLADISDLLKKINRELDDVEDASTTGEMICVCRAKCGYCEICVYEEKVQKLRRELEDRSMQHDILMVEKSEVAEERKMLRQQIEQYKLAKEVLDIDRAFFNNEKKVFGIGDHTNNNENRDDDDVLKNLENLQVGETEEQNKEFIGLSDDPITLTSKILLPSEQMVGRIIGTGGRTIKHLETVTKCKLAVRGRGVHSGGNDDSKPLHVEVTCVDSPEVAHRVLADAIEKLRSVIKGMAPPQEIPFGLICIE